MVILQNEKIAVKILKKGAELYSLQSLADNTEYIWQAGNEWPKHSPILFPIVGTLRNQTYSYEGEVYNLSRHGFAREQLFTVEHRSKEEATFLLTHTDESLQVYPFEFALRITYTLQEASVKVTYQVTNSSTKYPLYYSIGGHPAFKVPIEPPLTFEDYHLLFEFHKETSLPVCKYPLTADGLTKEHGSPYFDTHSALLPLRQSLFEQDALVFKNLNSGAVTLASERGRHQLKLVFTDFPYMGIWNKCGASFVCIEPWLGITDSERADGNISQKEGICTLAPQESSVASWQLFVS